MPTHIIVGSSVLARKPRAILWVPVVIFYVTLLAESVATAHTGSNDNCLTMLGRHERQGQDVSAISQDVSAISNDTVKEAKALDTLSLGKPIEKEIVKGQTDRHRIELGANHYILVSVDYRGIDLSLAAYGPDGTQIAEVKDEDNFQGPLLCSILADAAGSYRIEVRAPDKEFGKRIYKIEIAELRAATLQDKDRLAAQQAITEAARLKSEEKAENLQKALVKYEEALQLWKSLNDRKKEAVTLSGIGSIYNMQGEAQKALDYFNQSLSIHRAVGDRRGEATTLNKIGAVYIVLGEMQKARDYHNQTLELGRALGDGKLEAGALHHIGLIHHYAGETQKAMDHYNRSIELSRAIGDLRAEAVTLGNIGGIYNAMGETQKALDYHNRVLPLRRAAGDRRGEATTYNYIGAVYQNTGEMQKALDYHSRALELSRALGDRKTESTSLNNVAGVYDNLGDPQKALDYYNQALTLSRAVGERRTERTALGNLGLVYYRLGEPMKALDYYHQALELSRALGDRVGVSSILGNTGNVYNALGDQQKALDYHNQALALNRAIGDRRGEANALGNLGLVYNTLGEPQKALDYHNQALLLRRAVGDRLGEASTLSNIAGCYQRLSELHKALDYYNQALSLCRAVSNPRGEASTLANIGVAYQLLGQPQKALDYYNQSLPLSRAVMDRSQEAHTLSIIGTAFQLLGQPQKALDYYNQALPLSREVQNKTKEANCLRVMASAYLELGDLSQARTHIQAGLNVIESVRSGVISKDLRASYLDSVHAFYKIAIEVLMQSHKQHPTEGFDREALHMSERARARSLLELIAESGTDIRQGVDPHLLEREQSLQQQLSFRAAQQARLISGKQSEQETAPLAKEIDSLLNEYEQVRAQIRQNSPRYAALTQPSPLKLNEIQSLLDSDTMLLEYALGEKRSYLWAVTATSIASFELPAHKDIEAAANHVFDLLTARNRPDTSIQKRRSRLAQTEAQYTAAASELSRMILGPLASLSGMKRLIVVPDGALQYIPFAALPSPGAGGKTTNPSPLIVEHEIVNLPSASVLAVLRQEYAARQPATKKVAVLADPVFKESDLRVRAKNRDLVKNAAQGSGEGNFTSGSESVSAAILARSAREATLMSDASLPRLEYTRVLADLIAAMAPPGESLKALDFAASRATATSKELSLYRTVIFASHGLLNSNHPELSGIVLSLVDRDGKPQDGFLRLHDVYNMNLRADLVILGACETGLGKDIKGEGLVGLTRGFMYAGTPRVMASLWKVDEDATVELIKRVYKKMEKEAQTPAAALREAQIEMWREKRWQQPYYWSGFILQGEWK